MEARFPDGGGEKSSADAEVAQSSASLLRFVIFFRLTSVNLKIRKLHFLGLKNLLAECASVTDTFTCQNEPKGLTKIRRPTVEQIKRDRCLEEPGSSRIHGLHSSVLVM